MIHKQRYGVEYIFIIIFAFFYAVSANAASIYFFPSSVNQSTGQIFSVSVQADTNGQLISGAQGSIVFDPAKLEVISISKSDSIFNFWIQDPIYSNSDGTLSFEGGVSSPSYNVSSGLIITISFHTKTGVGATGSTSVNVVSGTMTASDGQRTNILSNLGKLSLSITDTSATPQPVSISAPHASPIVPKESIPNITSSTHPDSKKWYSNNNPQFAWSLPPDVTGVSYLVTDKVTSNPGPKSDGIHSGASFTSIGDGIQYFHLKFKQNGAWGTIAHFQFNIDTVAPAGFDIKTIGNDPTRPKISFGTTDALSGIDHYEVRIGDGPWNTVSADQVGTPYALSTKQSGVQTVEVKAIDKAGNTTTESTQVSVPGSAVGSSVATWIAKLFNGIVNTLSGYGLWLLLLAALIGVLILIFQWMSEGLDKAWHRLDDTRKVRKAERKVDTTFTHIIDDMKKEIAFLDTIAKRRPLGPEEKYLKSKLQQYIKGLKGNRK